MGKPRFSQKETLSKQLLIPLVSSFILIVSIIAFLVFYDLRDNLEESIHNRLLISAQTHQTQLETLFSYRALNTAAWAKLEVMDDIITEDVDGRINRSIQELKKSYQLHGDIFVFDINNHLIASSNPEFPLKKIAPDLTLNYKTKYDELSFKGKHTNPYSSEPSVAFSYSITASFDSSTVLGSTVVTIPWHIIQNIVVPDSMQGMLLNRSGDMLSGSIDTPPPFSISNLITNSEITIANENYLIASSQITSLLNMPLDWLVVSMEYEEQALKPIRLLGQDIILVTVPLTLLIVLLIIMLTRRVVNPILYLTNTILDIEKSSDLSKRVDVESTNETGILADSFNKMTDKLEKSMAEKDTYANQLARLNENLEQQVLNRTADYRAANDELQIAINQLQQAQSQLIQSEKMASLGQLVAGIAHEINNPLGSINANIPIMIEYTTDLFQFINSIENQSSIKNTLADIDYDFIQEDTPQLLASMKNATKRMKDIVLSLRNFSRLDQAELQDIRLEEAIDNTLALLSHRFKGRITIKKEYLLNKNVPCYAGLINQVLMNLLSNAEQAISANGTVTIKTWLDGDAYVSIQDSGMGMNQDIMAKIFDPFFTTKSVGEGTGMGLSISYGIIEEHQGSIAVDSKTNEGTTFTLHLPMTLTKQMDIT